MRSALGEWAAQDLTGVDVDELATDLVELELVSGLIEVERARRLVVFEDRLGPVRYGFPSPTAFLMAATRMASGRARRLVAMARAGACFPGVSRAWQEQRISTDQAYRLLEAALSAPEEFSEAEAVLVDAVEPLDHGDTRRVLSYWVEAMRGPGEATAPRVEELRGLSLSRTMDGMGRVDGWLTPEAYQVVQTALDALMPPPGDGEERSPRQRRHDALADLARAFLDGGDTPMVGGERPHLSLICDLPALQGVAGGVHEYEDGEVVTVGDLRRVACDCSLSRIVFGPRSEIIDVGRRARVIPTAVRRAVIARDRHCAWSGCQRPARWCDVHHIRHWADGGSTTPDNLTLLCRFHHTLTHRQATHDWVPPPGQSRPVERLVPIPCRPNPP